MGLKFRPKTQQVRLIYSDELTGMDHVKQNPGKVFAVIGPFESHMDKADLQDALQLICRGYNLEEK